MALPARFEIVVTRPSAHEMSGSNAAGDVQTLESSVSAAMDSTNTAVSGCQAMSATDVQSWNGIYSGWATWDQDLRNCLTGTPPDQYAPPTVQCIMAYGLNWATAMSKLASYQSQAQAWQARVHASCPTFNPAPIPSPVTSSGPGSLSGSWFCRTMGWGCGAAGAPADSSVGWPDALKWMAILGIGVIAVWYVGPLIATVAGVGVSAIRKRASGREEFEPVAMYGRDAANFSFGNMAIEAPSLEPLQFGEVAKDAVLDLIGDGS